MSSMATPFTSLTIMEIYSFEVSVENGTGSIPEWDLMCFTVIIMNTFPQTFPGPMMIPCDMLILIDLQTCRDAVLDEKK